MRPLKPYTYIPDEAVDLGVAGEHFPSFTAWIDQDVSIDGSPTYEVRIAIATVDKIDGDLVQTINITPDVQNSSYWKACILNSWLDKHTRRFDEGA